MRPLLLVCDIEFFRCSRRPLKPSTKCKANYYGAVHSMTRLVLKAIMSKENPQVLIDLHRICGEEIGSTWEPKSPQEIAGRIFYVRTPKWKLSIIRFATEANMPQTAYTGIEKNSSPQTRKRAADLAEVIGANHLDFECVPYSKTPISINYHYSRTILHCVCYLRYANLNPTALTPYMTRKLSSSPPPLVLSRSSRYMVAPTCQTWHCSKSLTLSS